MVTLLCAPAGAGKTTLMACWAENRITHGERVAWLNLDHHDNDPAIFWAGLLAAAAHATDDPQDTPAVAEVQDLPVDPRRGWESFLRLEALVAAADGPLWLFLDDLQEIQAPSVLADLDALVRNLPGGLGLVLASRRDPPVGLHRLRLAGRLREIRAADLALERTEVRRLLDDHGVALDEDDLSLLVGRTEGWAAGVRLAALALSVSGDPSAVVRDFATDDRAVADYLTAEILSRLGRSERRLLRACAVPEQVTPELAVALTGDAADAEALERLHRDNILVVRLTRPGRWFRLHSMLRGYLLAELRRSDPALLATLHAGAARWFAEHGPGLWAVTHAIATGDRQLALRMLTEHGPGLLADGRPSALLSVIEAAGPDVRSDPDVGRLEALATLEVEQELHGAIPWAAPGAAPEDGGLANGEQSTALDALVALQAARYVDPGLSDVALAGSEAITTAPGDGLALLMRQSRGIVLALTGQLDEAEEELTAALRATVRSGNDNARLRTLSALTGVASCRCDFRRTQELADDGMQLAARIGEASSPAAAFLGLQAAHAAYQLLDHEQARRLAAPALSRAFAEPMVCMSATALVADMDVTDGREPFEAARRLRDCWAIGAGQPRSVVTGVRIAFAQHRCSWLVGRPDWAHDAVQRLGDTVGAGGEFELLVAAEHLARGRAGAARRRLGPVLDCSVACELPVSLQQAWLMEAVLAAAAGEEANSFAALAKALVLADELQARHVFLDVPGAAALLDDNSSRFGQLNTLAEEIRAAARTRQDLDLVLLTPKELELLVDLPAPLTLEEIAGRHQVSVNTVKTHVRSIYQKLSAGSRREAVSIARRKGVL